MKKTLILAGILAIALGSQCYAAENTASNVVPKKATCAEKQAPADMQKPPKAPDCKCNKKADFEKRLKLTDKQKAEAKAIRERGHEAMEPLMKQIQQKHEEIRKIRQSTTLKAEEQKAKIDKLHNELRDLEKKAHELRMQNMKEFESILTKKQLKELKKMKDEGRKKFDKEFKKNHGGDFRPPFPPGFGGPRPPMGPDGAPDFPPPPPAPNQAK